MGCLMYKVKLLFNLILLSLGAPVLWGIVRSFVDATPVRNKTLNYASLLQNRGYLKMFLAFFINRNFP